MDFKKLSHVNVGVGKCELCRVGSRLEIQIILVAIES